MSKGHSPNIDDGKFRVRQSSVKLWRKCHYAYHLRYNRKLRKKVISRSLHFGTVVHEMFEAYAEGNDPMGRLADFERELQNSKMFRQEKEEYGDIITDIRQIMHTYFEYYDERDLRFIRLKGRSAEHKFEIDIAPDILLTGKIDGYARTPNKLQWLVEHKTFKRAPSEDQLWRNVQSSIYIRVTDMLGWLKGGIEGMVWDYIHNKPPTKPAMLKSGLGRISKMKINTLPITVRETLKSLKLNPKDYQSYLDDVDSRLGEWFFRIHTPVNPDVIDMIWRDFVDTAKRMAEGSDRVMDKCIEQHCSWCEYEPICRAELEDSDVDYVVQREYYVHEGDEYEASLVDSAS